MSVYTIELTSPGVEWCAQGSFFPLAVKCPWIDSIFKSALCTSGCFGRIELGICSQSCWARAQHEVQPSTRLSTIQHNIISSFHGSVPVRDHMSVVVFGFVN